MRKAIATVTLSGDLYEKFEACAAAGYQGVEIFENDLMLFDRTPEEVRELARSFSLDILSLQPLRDFEALPEETMKKNLLRAARKFELMQRLGAQHLLVCSNTSAQAQDNSEQAAADLARLAEMGKAHGIAVGYSALAWGRHVNRYEQAWEIVRMADHSHLGLVVNSFHLFAAGSDLALLQQLPLNKLSYVQLADAPRSRVEKPSAQTDTPCSRKCECAMLSISWFSTRLICPCRHRLTSLERCRWLSSKPSPVSSAVSSAASSPSMANSINSRSSTDACGGSTPTSSCSASTLACSD